MLENLNVARISLGGVGVQAPIHIRTTDNMHTYITTVYVYANSITYHKNTVDVVVKI